MLTTAVLGKGGTILSWVVSLLFTDIILIYRKDYGWKATIRIRLIFYAAPHR